MTKTVNELKLTEAYLQKKRAWRLRKHRAERDGLSQALEAANDTLSATESQLQTVSAQLAELYEEVEEYRTQGGSEDEELIETQKALDAVIDKFKICGTRTKRLWVTWKLKSPRDNASNASTSKLLKLQESNTKNTCEY